jgi:hypothetical protein
MDETKNWYTSKGVWGGVVTMILGIVTMILGIVAASGTDLSAEQGAITDLLVQAGVVVGGLIAMVGRLTAKSKIGK